MMRLFRRSVLFRRLLLPILVVGVIVVGVYLVKTRIEQPSSPWFGRGGSLGGLHYTIIVGPVDSIKGIPGLVEIGMQRNALVRSIGSPLIAGMSIREPEKRGFMDPEDVSADFFDGVFAWIQYDYRHAVQSITFDLRAFAKKFGGRQKVLLAHCGRTYLLHEGLSQSNVVALFGTKADSGVQVQGSDLVIKGTGTSLRFGDGGRRLESISIIEL